KGLAAVMLAVIMAKAAQSSAQFVDLCAALGAICSLMGHSYSIWLGFRGGKGVATLMGALFGINWIRALIVGVVWNDVFEAMGYVSLVSLAAVVAVPIALVSMLFL